MGWILRVFNTRDPAPMMMLYRSLVVPIAEYCCQLWNPAAIGQIAAIEGIQRTFTSKIAGLQDLNYWERLERLSLLFATAQKGKIPNHLRLEDNKWVVPELPARCPQDQDFWRRFKIRKKMRAAAAGQVR